MRKNGFSLVEVMVVTAILGVVGLGFSQLISNFSRSQQSLSQKMVAIDTQNTMAELTANSGQCSANFKNLSWPTNNPPAAISIATPGLQWFNTTTNAVSSVAVRLGPQNNAFGLQISSITLDTINNLGGGLFSARLQSNFSGSNVALNSAKVSNVLLSTTAVGGNDVVQTCSSGSQGATVLGTFRLDTGANPVGFGASANYPYSMNHIYCRAMTFTPGWTQSKVYLTGSVQYSSLASTQPAHDHGYSFFPIGINAATGTTTICVDNNSGDVHGIYSREIFTWTVWGMP